MQTITRAQLIRSFEDTMKQVEESGEEFIVTDGNNPVIQIKPYASPTTVDELFKDMRGQVKINGDLTEPTIDEWNEV